MTIAFMAPSYYVNVLSGLKFAPQLADARKSKRKFAQKITKEMKGRGLGFKEGHAVAQGIALSESPQQA
jgi:hypothetical protein